MRPGKHWALQLASALYIYLLQIMKSAFIIALQEARWNAHLRVKIFKSSLFSLLYIQQATPEVMFEKEYSKI